MKFWSVASLALALVLTACGGGGGGGGGVGVASPLVGAATSSPTASMDTSSNSSDSSAAASQQSQPSADPAAQPTQPVATRGLAFALLPAQLKIASVSGVDGVANSAVNVRLIDPFTKLYSKQAALNGPLGMHLAYDATRDRLYISRGDHILVLYRASTLEGSVEPGQFQLIGTGLNSTSHLALDQENDELWVAGSMQDGGVLVKVRHVSAAAGQVFAIGQTPQSYDRQVYPIRTLSLAGFTIDKIRSRAYVFSMGTTTDAYDLKALVEAPKDITGTAQFNSDPATKNGPVGQFSTGAYLINGDVAVQAGQDRLYGVDIAHESVIIVDGASTASAVVPFTKLMVPKVVSVAVDSADDRLYVGGRANEAYVFNGASAVTESTPLPTPLTLIPGGEAANSPVWGFAFR